MPKLFKQQITFRLGELFCGPGGIALGAIRSKYETDTAVYTVKHVWANDYDEPTCATYAQNICPSCRETVFCQDVRNLDIKSLEKIDAFAYGFPCNDFSIVGEKKGFEGEFGPLYTYGIKVLDYHKPKFFLAENVSGLSSANEGAAFRKILHDLQNAGNGYELTAHTYNADQYGVPQSRRRIIIVGIDKTLGLKFRVPFPTTKNNPVDAKTALEKPPISEHDPHHRKTSQSKTVVERLKYIKPGQNAWNADIPPHLQLNVKGAKLSQIYRRLEPDKPAYTVTACGGGGTHMYHWEEHRALTNREKARLQTFPDNFQFAGSKESVRRQIGMAVPPKLSEVIFTHILMTFAGVSYPSVPENIEVPSAEKQLSLNNF